MVHRKSTYKLNFKNISGNDRRNIWEENSILRQKRRTEEMSHHSIDQTDSECECDSEPEEIQFDRKEDSCSSKAQHTSLVEGKKDSAYESEGDVEERSERESRTWSRNWSRSEAGERSCRELSLSNGRVRFEEDGCRNGLRKGMMYSSETQLDRLSEKSPLSGRKGVMKLTPVTGEFDLIPARLKLNSKHTTKEDGDARRKSCYVKVRPRSSIYLRHNDDNYPAKMELASIRKEPRMHPAMERGKLRNGTSVCPRCGEKVKQRGICT